MSIALEHVNYIYSPGTAYEKRALNDISLEIGQGQFVGIIGHTGSGKSTLIQHLNGLMKATSGDILYDGQSIYAEGYDMRKLRSQVGLVFQYPEHQLFEVDVISDVCFGPKNQGLSEEESEKNAREALELVGFPEKYYKQSPTEIMLRMTEEAADTARAAPGNEGMQEREADPAMQIRRIMKTMIVLMSRKTGTAMKILKNCSRKDVGWILKIWRILMSRKNMEITGMTRI